MNVDGVQHRDTLRPNVQRIENGPGRAVVRMGVLEATLCESCWQWVRRFKVGAHTPFSHPWIQTQFSGPCGLLSPGPHLLLSHVSLETWAPLGPPDCSHHF